MILSALGGCEFQCLLLDSSSKHAQLIAKVLLRVVGGMDCCTDEQIKGVLQGHWLDSEIL
jgi:hypothetical protein